MQLTPLTTKTSVVSIGKFGSFPVNLLLGRPYFLTYEITDKQHDNDSPRLRVVPASELNAEVLSEDATSSESRADPVMDGGDGFDIVAEDGSVLMKNNRLTVDDANRQTLTMEEIEELKKSGSGSGKDIIDKIMKSHANLDEKTAFSLAKYTLRKTKKYMRRFTVLPMDVSMVAQYMLTEKDNSKTMELREESIGLIGSWANVHHGASSQPHVTAEGNKVGGGRWLVVDETGGLIVASLAERMGLLYPHDEEEDANSTQQQSQDVSATAAPKTPAPVDAPKADVKTDQGDVTMQDVASADNGATTGDLKPEKQPQSQPKPRHPRPASRAKYEALATNNTIHLIHANAQPNVSLLKYFGYDSNNPTLSHPIHNHLKSLSWLQLLEPNADATYEEPEVVPSDVLDSWKSGKRGTYYKKRRRWEKCKSIVDETRQGGFDGLIVASSMDPATVLKHTVPLLAGAAHVVVYSPTIEPLTDLMDYYSRDRKTAYLSHISQETTETLSEDDFPVDPRLLLAPTLQTSKIRDWQVLPGRTHPKMTGRGGAEGYIFTARKVNPVEGTVEARGKYNKKRRLE